MRSTSEIVDMFTARDGKNCAFVICRKKNHFLVKGDRVNVRLPFQRICFISYLLRVAFLRKAKQIGLSLKSHVIWFEIDVNVSIVPKPSFINVIYNLFEKL